MSLKSSLDPRLGAQILRCRAALRILDVPDQVIMQLEETPPLLFQMAHLRAFKEMHDWRDALRWVYDHRWEIYAYADGVIDEQGEPSSGRADAKANGDDVGSAREGQPLRFGDDGLPVGGGKDPTRGD